MLANIPKRIVGKYKRTLDDYRERRLAKLPLPDAFDAIYRKGLWKEGCALSGRGSEGSLATQYVDFLARYAKEHNMRSVVDAGCGDFSIGSKLLPYFESYTGVDCSAYIINSNRRTFTEVPFVFADLTTEQCPDADLITVRQVLQHLTNQQISAFLFNLSRSKWRRLLITEEVCDPGKGENPNLDLRSHTNRTRVSLGSGVFVDKPPFNLDGRRIACIREQVEGKRPQILMVFEASR